LPWSIGPKDVRGWGASGTIQARIDLAIPINENAEIDHKHKFHGESSLKITYRKDEHFGLSLDYFFVKPVDCAYARYYTRYDEDFSFKTGGEKMSGFRAVIDRYNPAGRGGERPNGYNGFSIRPHTDRKGRIRLQVYHPGQTTQYGDSYSTEARIRPGEWHCVEVMLKANSIDMGRQRQPVPDGEVKLWFDGELAGDQGGMIFRETPNLHIANFWLQAYYGGNWFSPKEQHKWYDHIVCAEEYVGPMEA